MAFSFLRPLAGVTLLCALQACSSSEPSGGDGGLVRVAAEPTTAAAEPIGQQAQSAVAAPAAAPFSTFDFAKGTRLPDKAVLSVGNATFTPGASAAHVPVTLDRPTANTVVARLTTVNGSGATKALSGYQYDATSTVVIFRPGDPLRQTVRIPILAAKQGQQFSVKLVEAPWGATQGAASATVTADANRAATNSAQTGFRAPRTFQAKGTLQFDMTKATMRWSDAGHAGAWSTKLSHGRAQPANGETGMYLDGYVYPGIEAPLRYTDHGLVLHTQKLKSPLNWNGVPFSYGAVVLSGHNTPVTQIGYGQYEWVAKMPNRHGSWPAFWLVSTSGWPPEIDVYEGFGYQSYWNFDAHVAATLHGGANGTRSFQRGSVMQAQQAYGLSGFSQGFHSYAVDIQADYITWFVDGQETYQSVNPFAGFRFYPIMNVAVKASGDYADGSGDMVVKSFRVWAQ